MALPPNFSEWEHLQSQVRHLHNQRVKEYFEDIELDDDISTPRGSLKQACLLKDKDSAILTCVRMMFFEFTIGNARSLQAPLYGMPVSQFQEEFEVEYRPMVRLYFAQDINAVPDGFWPIQQEMSFRLMDETWETISKSKLLNLAQLIRNKFWTYNIDKGKIKCRYVEPSKGYRLAVNAISETEGINVIKDVLQLRGHTINEKCLTISDKVKRVSDNTPGNGIVLGKTIKRRRWRPTATVKFRFSSVSIFGLDKDPILVDRTGQFPQALISR